MFFTENKRSANAETGGVGGNTSHAHMQNSDLKFEVGKWYEIGLDLDAFLMSKAMELHLFKNYDTCYYTFKQVHPIYVKELEIK